jgi:hypothetical protein
MADIAAIRVISLSELYKADPKFTEFYAMQNEEELKQVLYKAGIDTNQPFEHQVNQHRNNFNEVYTGSRFVGLERIDADWISSGLASHEAKDKASGSRLLVDLYRSKGLTDDRAGGVWEDEDEPEETDESNKQNEGM